MKVYDDWPILFIMKGGCDTDAQKESIIEKKNQLTLINMQAP